jgi:hypothetical protein
MPIDEEHPAMRKPRENLRLWKYMDIPSFLSLLTSNSLTFIRADLFEDNYEGKLPIPTASMVDYTINQLMNNDISDPKYLKVSDDEEIIRKNVYLNCWCKESHEMVHMWKIYSKENGVAIETTYENLKSSINSTETVFPTEIQYLDYEHALTGWQAGALTAFTIKRKEYKSENEFRLMIAFPRIIEDQLMQQKNQYQKLNDPERMRLYSEIPVIKCEVDISDLISKVYISPYAPKWYHTVIVDITKKCGLDNIDIIQSKL